MMENGVIMYIMVLANYTRIINLYTKEYGNMGKRYSKSEEILINKIFYYMQNLL